MINHNYAILENFTREYKEKYLDDTQTYDDSIVGSVKSVRQKLLNETFLPSLQLKQVLDKLIRKAMHPIEIAVSGQFSSGKSTFLNTLLGKDILPTGITPVTSKVNFLSYGKSYKLRITYHSGLHEYRSVESIGDFTDQRRSELDDIKYLTIFAPIALLNEISFVDTPGLNSLSFKDTQTTKNVLNDVGGIIWLTLIDNAGKESEKNTLDKYMPRFQEKSLCILNQKDKLNEEEVLKTLTYVETNFSKYFKKVIPISAKEALQAKTRKKSVQIQKEVSTIISKFEDELALNLGQEDMGFFNDSYMVFQEKIKSIEKQVTHAKALHVSSNIDEVLTYIDQHINHEKIIKDLFNNKHLLPFEIKINNSMKKLEVSISKDFNTSYKVFEDEILQWQKHYVLLKKNREISSTLEFARIQKFASQAYQTILKSYNDSLNTHLYTLGKDISYQRSMITGNNKAKVSSVISSFEHKISEHEKYYLQNSKDVHIEKPSQSEILESLKETFGFYDIQTLLTSKNNILHKNIHALIHECEEIRKDKMHFIQTKKEPYEKKRTELQKIRNSISQEEPNHV
jgi:GTP-binding protein EngB required for normal cell division